MKISKPSEDDKADFPSIVPNAAGAEVKPMFGNTAGFVNGNMCMGLFGPDVGVRRSEDDRVALPAIEGSGPFGPEGRPMKEDVSMPPAWRDDPTATAAWVDKALRSTAAMPPKQKKT